MKLLEYTKEILGKASPSVWREWIEIPVPRMDTTRPRVSLRVEGVD